MWNTKMYLVKARKWHNHSNTRKCKYMQTTTGVLYQIISKSYSTSTPNSIYPEGKLWFYHLFVGISGINHNIKLAEWRETETAICHYIAHIYTLYSRIGEWYNYFAREKFQFSVVILTFCRALYIVAVWMNSCSSKYYFSCTY